MPLSNLWAQISCRGRSDSVSVVSGRLERPGPLSSFIVTGNKCCKYTYRGAREPAHADCNLRSRQYPCTYLASGFTVLPSGTTQPYACSRNRDPEETSLESFLHRATLFGVLEAVQCEKIGWTEHADSPSHLRLLYNVALLKYLLKTRDRRQYNLAYRLALCLD